MLALGTSTFLKYINVVWDYATQNDKMFSHKHLQQSCLHWRLEFIFLFLLGFPCGFRDSKLCNSAMIYQQLNLATPNKVGDIWRHFLENFLHQLVGTPLAAAWGLGCTLCGFAWCRFLRHVIGRTEGRTCSEGKCRNASKFYIGSNFTRRRRWQLRGWSHSLLHVCVRQKKFHPILTSCCNPRLHKLHFLPKTNVEEQAAGDIFRRRFSKRGKGFKSGPPRCLAALWPQSCGASPWHDFPIQDISGFVKMFSSPV